MTLKNKLKEIDIGITELSQFLDISRPTMYKFIEFFDEKKFNKINKSILKLFNYIYENELIGKNNVINYILKNIIEIKENDDNESKRIKKITHYIKHYELSEKVDFIEYISEKNDFDQILSFFLQIIEINKKKKVTDLEKRKIKLFNNFKNEINKFKGENDE